MSLGEPRCRATASSVAGMINDTTRPIGLTVLSVGMKTVACPRPCWDDGGVDILVHVAGGGASAPSGGFARLTHELWQRTLELTSSERCAWIAESSRR